MRPFAFGIGSDTQRKSPLCNTLFFDLVNHHFTDAFAAIAFINDQSCKFYKR